MITIRTPGLDDLHLDPTEGRIVRKLDLGYPTVRTVASSRPMQDGENDQTAFLGGRSVAIDLLLVGRGGYSKLTNRDLIAARLHPRLRSELLFDDDLLGTGGPLRRILIRGDQGSAPVTNPISDETQFQWRGYTGIIEAADTSTVTFEPPDPDDGAPFDWEFPVTFPEAGLDTTDVTTGGTIPAWPQLRIDGPCTGPAIWCGDDVLYFPGLEVAADQWLDIDTTNRTVLLNGVADRRFALDYTTSTWWALQPGPNALRFDAEAWSTPSAVTLTWRDTYLL